ncbi:GNAT family N-acetyltransferase [Erysipelothrix urinaevulpis]|uniref:GNAT family N-acetyltransferase n=1 Tax=Erysipelothrix urinaevulpis TaxID=2683717 RepID=UPI001358772F|nr:GNAT family N-acetyltransferase [Erysipelothrix urinaevulpis]
MNDEIYMNLALQEAFKAYDSDEVPVGAVIVYQDQVIAMGHNMRESKQSSISHAEIEVIKEANKLLGSWRLSECTLYVTLEPCMMCSGAIQQSRIRKIVYAATDHKMGFMSRLNNYDYLNHYPIVRSGVLKEESESLIKEYFMKKRKEKVFVKELNDKYMDDYHCLRIKVFVEEQGVSLEEEFDQYDEPGRKDVKHIGALVDDEIVGTMRLLIQKDTLVLGRLTVLKSQRGLDIGTKLVTYAIRQAENQGFNEVILGAQVNAVPFYEKNGFEMFGEIYLDAGIKHIKMKKNTKK